MDQQSTSFGAKVLNQRNGDNPARLPLFSTQPSRRETSGRPQTLAERVLAEFGEQVNFTGWTIDPTQPNARPVANLVISSGYPISAEIDKKFWISELKEKGIINPDTPSLDIKANDYGTRTLSLPLEIIPLTLRPRSEKMAEVTHINSILRKFPGAKVIGFSDTKFLLRIPSLVEDAQLSTALSIGINAIYRRKPDGANSIVELPLSAALQSMRSKQDFGHY